jgi:hypothetical protein
MEVERKLGVSSLRHILTTLLSIPQCCTTIAVLVELFVKIGKIGRLGVVFASHGSLQINHWLAIGCQ